MPHFYTGDMVADDETSYACAGPGKWKILFSDQVSTETFFQSQYIAIMVVSLTAMHSTFWLEKNVVENHQITQNYIVKFWTQAILGPFFLIFMQFSAKYGQIIAPPPFGLAPPHLGNPGSAIAIKTLCFWFRPVCMWRHEDNYWTEPKMWRNQRLSKKRLRWQKDILWWEIAPLCWPR